MLNSIKKLLDYLYKKKCYFCSSSKENSKFCSSCYEKIDFSSFNPIKSINNSNIYGCCIYKKEIQKLIRGIKYHNQEELAFYQAKIMFEYWEKIKNKENFYLVVPVPLHKSRIKSRKYNHMDLVGKEFCKLTGYSFKNDIIERIKDTVPQYKLSIKERENNLKNAFKINLKEDLKTPILIIDDITTTGSTLFEIIKEFNKKDITNVTGLTTAFPEKENYYIY